MQISLGGWTSSNYAALACPDLPTCQEQWLPPMNFSEGFNISQSIGPNYLGGQLHAAARTAIHFTHRIGAILTFLLLSLLVWQTFKVSGEMSRRSRSSLRMFALLVLVILIVQICLGLGNIIWSLPLNIAVAHNLGGALLLISLVAYNFRLRRAEV